MKSLNIVTALLTYVTKVKTTQTWTSSHHHSLSNTVRCRRRKSDIIWEMLENVTT